MLAGLPPPALPEEPAALPRILAILTRHRLLGMWAHLHGTATGSEAGGVEAVPGPWRDEVRSWLLRETLRADLTLEAAGRARAVLGEAGVGSILLKGAALLRSGTYPGGGARPLGDADLLLREEIQADRAVRALEAAGFTPWVPWDPGRAHWLPAFTLSAPDAPPGIDVSLDLHWRVPWTTFRSGSEGGDGLLWSSADLDRGLPAPEPHAVLLAEHFVRHLRVQPHLLGLADLCRVLPDVTDPELLVRFARDRGSLPTLRALGWALASELDRPLPSELARALGVPSKLPRRAQELLDLERLLEAGEERRLPRVAGILGQAAIQGSRADLARQAFHVLFPPAGWLRERAGPGAGGGLRVRLGYWGELIRWTLGRGPSPLAPNQEFEGPRGRT